jgi:divalent metal cation (Fe/Co/Zn/Cd) transporter
MDGIEPELVDRARLALAATPGVEAVPALQLRWIGHRLQGNATIQVADMPISAGQQIVRDAERRLGQALPNLDGISVRAAAVPADAEAEADVVADADVLSAGTKGHGH